MKKALSILLLIALCASLCVAAFATEEAAISVSSVNAAPGETVTVTVSIDANPGIMGLQVKFDYDTTVLTLNKITAEEIGGVWTIDEWALWDNSEDSTYVGKILTLEFVVAETAEYGKSYPVTVEVAAANYDEEDVIFNVTAGSIDVACEHVWGEWEVTTPATCKDKGVETRTCSVCGETETRETETVGHTWGEWVVTTPATCTENGVETRTCSVCGETETRVIEATGHVDADDDGFCDCCDMAMPSPDTGDSIYVAVAAAVISMMGIVALTKKREF